MSERFLEFLGVLVVVVVIVALVVLVIISPSGKVKMDLLGRMTIHRPPEMVRVMKVLTGKSNSPHELQVTTVFGPDEVFLGQNTYSQGGLGATDSIAINGGLTIGVMTTRINVGIQGADDAKIVAVPKAHADGTYLGVRLTHDGKFRRGERDVTWRLFLLYDCDGRGACEQLAWSFAEGPSMFDRLIGFPDGGFYVAATGGDFIGALNQLPDFRGASGNWWNDDASVIAALSLVARAGEEFHQAAFQAARDGDVNGAEAADFAQFAENKFGGHVYQVSADNVALSGKFGDTVLLRPTFGDVWVLYPDMGWAKWEMEAVFNYRFNDFANLKNVLGIGIGDIFENNGSLKNINPEDLKYVEVSGWVNTPHPELEQIVIKFNGNDVGVANIFSVAGGGYAVLMLMPDNDSKAILSAVEHPDVAPTLLDPGPCLDEQGNYCEWTDQETTAYRAQKIAQAKFQTLIGADSLTGVSGRALVAVSDDSLVDKDCTDSGCTYRILTRDFSTETWFYPSDADEILGLSTIVGYYGAQNVLGTGFAYAPQSGNDLSPSILLYQCVSGNRLACVEYALAGQPVFEMPPTPAELFEFDQPQAVSGEGGE